MNVLIRTKLFLISLFFVFLGVLSLVMENIFYGYIGKNVVLQESYFLPIGTTSFLLGLSGMVISITWFYLKRMNKPRS